MTSNSEKLALRARMKSRRERLNSRRQDAELLQQNIINYLIDIDFSAVFCYLSTADEAPTWELVKHLHATPSITITCPRIVDKTTMIAVPLKSLAQLERGPLGIYTSRETEPCEQRIDVAIVPGLAFTPSGARLGYGGGYYDRWFDEHPSCYRIAFCYDGQMLDTLPTEAHDVAMHAIVTEKRVYQCSKP